MGKRPASCKATRGVSKAKKPHSSSSSNPKTRKFRSQYNSLAVIAKGGPSRKIQNKESLKQLARDASERQKLLDGLENINMVEPDSSIEGKANDRKSKKRGGEDDNNSIMSRGTKMTTASFASVWSNCTNASLNEFFHIWNPNLETHKDALAVIAGLSQTMSSMNSEQSDMEYTRTLFKIISTPETPTNVLTGALLALTFILRKLHVSEVNENFDSFYPVLKTIMEQYHECKKKTLLKSLIRCFACLSKAHPLGKESIESGLRKKINIAIRKCKVQDKVKL